MFKQFFILLVSVFSLLHAADPQNPSYKEGPIPSWITPCEFSLDPIPTKPSQVNFQCLLSDYQENWEEKTAYTHVAFKILNRTGIQNHSELQWSFVPSYQQLIVHQIRVYRDGQWTDRLGTSRHQLIQRENELEQKIYDGHLTLVYFLDDIRVGDIIEYAFSRVGVNPIFASTLATSVGLQTEFVMEKVFRRSIVHSAHDCNLKSFNNRVEPSIKDLPNNLREYVWEAYETTAYPWEKHVPDWYSGVARTHISQYKSWAEIAQKLVPLYSLSQAFLDNPPEEMTNLVNHWKEITDDPCQQALLAVRFVQDQIRYMGFEEGMGEYKPRDPALVFQRRFGDCKDKAFLLHVLLKLMDIQSTPALVNSKIGKRIHESLPSPFAFNHVILQIAIGDKPEYSPSKPTEIEASYVISTPEFAEMKGKITLYGFRAESVRKLIERRGIEKLAEDWLEDMQKTFKGASAMSSPIVEDDRKHNILTIRESYKIFTKEIRGEKVFRPCSFVIENYLDRNVNLERKTPYGLEFPLWVKERIHIENSRSSWLEESEHTEFKHPALNFSYDYKSKDNTLDFEYELKHVDDHVPVDLIKKYWNVINEIEETAPGNIKIDPSTVISEYIYTLLHGIGLIIIPWFLFSCLLYRQKRKKGYFL